MIISNIFRFLAGCLSAWYPNNQISKNKDTKLRKYIISKIKIIQINNNNLQKTHQIFNQKIIHLLQSKNLEIDEDDSYDEDLLFNLYYLFLSAFLLFLVFKIIHKK